MNLWEAAREAFDSLSANLLRSVLTMLGIIIGVGAVIALVSIGQGVQVLVAEQVQSLGSNLLFVLPGTLEGGPSSGRATFSSIAGASSPTPLTLGDARVLADPLAAPDLVRVAPAFNRFVEVVYGDESRGTLMVATTPEYAAVRRVEVALGEFIASGHEQAASRVAVLGSQVAERLFPSGVLPLGETIKINRVPFRVIGVMRPLGGTGFANQDDIVWVPLSTAHNRLFRERTAAGEAVVSAIYVQVVSEERMASASEQIAEILRRRHGILYAADDDFTIINQADVLSVFGEITGILTVFLASIAAISLLVGGIGIMNIMLVSVTERTREIGIRKAVGAKRSDILSQFLAEAVVLSVIGGGIGTALGIGGSQALTSLVPDLRAVISLEAILLATGFSIGVGLFFGSYPAWRAARLDPIQALRYE
ncbi:MAG: ABC transporter permease [Chloroflexi bacterium]|nr:ABC transporter permease [Chloroflexota bacterium]